MSAMDGMDGMDVDLHEAIDLDDGRMVVFWCVAPEDGSQGPSLVLEQFESNTAFERLEEDGRLCLKLHQVKALASALTEWQNRYERHFSELGSSD